MLVNWGMVHYLTNLQGLSRPGFFFTLKDFPGFSRPVDTLKMFREVIATKFSSKMKKLYLSFLHTDLPNFLPKFFTNDVFTNS
jgi:hypothetical protein